MDAEYFEQMKPRFLKPNEVEKPDANNPYPSVPAELKSRRQWVIWLYHLKAEDDKPSKMLYQTNGWAASTSNPKTWTTYSLALACYQKHSAGGLFEYRYRYDRKTPYQDFKCELAGIGYVFTAEDKYTGIDLDNCIVDGKVQPWAQDILAKFQGKAYIEFSPSGNGIKIWTRAKLPVDAKHKVYLQGNTGAAIEAYDRGRYFTVTGNGKYAIGDGQKAVNWLFEKYLRSPKPAQAARPSPPASAQNRNAEDVIGLIRKSKQFHKFDALMRGDTRGYGSASEADIALCAVIAFWTQDANIIDTIFRKSGLYREKWDEKHRSDGATYGEMTIEAVLSDNRETYSPKTRKKRYKKWRKTGRWLS